MKSSIKKLWIKKLCFHDFRPESLNDILKISILSCDRIVGELEAKSWSSFQLLEVKFCVGLKVEQE